MKNTSKIELRELIFRVSLMNQDEYMVIAYTHGEAVDKALNSVYEENDINVLMQEIDVEYVCDYNELIR